MAHQDYNLWQLIQMEACTKCRLCADVCPAVSASQDGHLSGVYRIKGLKEVLRKRSGLLTRLFGRKQISSEALDQFSETVFRCTLCGNCQEICPVGIHLKVLWLSIRQDLVNSGSYPEKVDLIRENLLESHNVFNEENEERADWVEDMDEPPDHGFIKEQAEVVYFTGCVASYFPLAQKIPINLSSIFEAAEVDFTLLGEAEWCCGFPLLGSGQKGLMPQFIEHNIDAVRQKKASKVVCACPTCYQMWREFYHAEFEIVHSTEFLYRLVKEGRLPLKELNLTVTYHDPCDLGRGARIFDEPREVLKAIPGVNFIELEANRENCRCCGGGGNLEMIDSGLSEEIAKQKIDEIMETGAQAVVTACQQCVRTMTTYVRRNQISLEVLDITELVYRALDS
ncbi:MAG: (Fe-S)-binding protein [Deltaproteobacteria bacterium]|nr:(Fe-S)-binding protein [Deltaproteobacteria bacterium]MBW2050752.1 (Fe-S)-binding protein [Deltaproteobacteria bacterium]MBW2140463.1 (Fe-S)-binding protein [Deltaproteobacteria bacterium]MBW2321988.1 (Fe-S)-binding protein [Deltaproteobacteria bacterium]